jgi:hypothetical protein
MYYVLRKFRRFSLLLHAQQTQKNNHLFLEPITVDSNVTLWKCELSRAHARKFFYPDNGSSRFVPLHGIISQKAVISISTIVRISNLRDVAYLTTLSVSQIV